MLSEPVFVGLDVATATVDVAVRPGGECWSVPNSDAGVGEIVARYLVVALLLVAVGRTKRGGTIEASPQSGTE